MTLTERDSFVINGFSTIIVAFSGGKDSLSCWRWALETGKPIRVIHTDTGNELPERCAYFSYLEKELGMQIEQYQRPGHEFFTICEKRGMWPIPGKCLVSRTTKVDDCRWYLKETNTPKDALLILGQRRSESRGRAMLPDFTPISRSGLPIYRPILDLSLDDVFTFLGDCGLKAHPAYGKGRKRVGCVWCVNSTQEDITRDAELYPQRCDQLRELRRSIGLSSCPSGISQLELFDQWPVCKYEAVHCE
jgi:3'-phosphoadenosine 5'-phosphosulfate sulfotransferase (PAPS reductase)/FAD synthetase